MTMAISAAILASALCSTCRLTGSSSILRAVTGPTVIEETDSTTVLYPGDRLALGPAGLLALTLWRAQ